MIADTKDTGDVLKGILQDGGYECVSTDDNAGFIDRVYGEHPDIIILNVNFAKPSGLEILEKLKAAPSTRDIPVMLSAMRRASKKIIKGYELGAYDYIAKPYFREEVLARLRNITYVLDKMKELEALLIRDYLTGLYNRKFFMDRLNEELAWSVIYKEPFSLMMVDIDYFKKINDTYGHACGDEVLKQLANVLLNVLRPQDIVARYGGEEFITLLPNACAAEAFEWGEKLRLAVQEGRFVCRKDGVTLPVTISMGVITFDGYADVTQDNLIGRADEALYAAKTGGRNRVMAYQR